MAYKLTTIEQDEDGETYRLYRAARTRNSLAVLVEMIYRDKLSPGSFCAGTGLTIIETVIEST